MNNRTSKTGFEVIHVGLHVNAEMLQVAKIVIKIYHEIQNTAKILSHHVTLLVKIFRESMLRALRGESNFWND